MFTKSEFKMLRERIMTVLKAVEYDMSVEFEDGNIRYDKNTATLQLHIYKNNKADAERLEFERLCQSYNLKPEDYRSSVVVGKGKVYTLVAINPKARAYPFVLEDHEGNRYKVSDHYVIKTLQKESV